MLDELRVEHFEPYLHQTFEIHLEDQSASLILELAEVTPLPDHSQGSKRRRPFSIILRSRDSVILPQCIYHIEHEHMGRLDLFLVPVGPDHKGMQYEALFT